MTTTRLDRRIAALFAAILLALCIAAPPAERGSHAKTIAHTHALVV